MPNSDFSSRLNLSLDDNIRLLYVDDDLILGEFAKAHLSSPNTTVVTATNGVQAWNLLNSEAVDIVLLDIEMPLLDGYGLLQKIRNDPRFQRLPVAMLTGREDIASIDRSYQLGANSFIPKPINWRQLSYALRYILRSTRIESNMLRERARFEEVSQFTNDVLSLMRSELRAPLENVTGLAERMRATPNSVNAAGAAGQRDYAREIRDATEKLQDTLRDLIRCAQLGAEPSRGVQEREYSASSVMELMVAELAQWKNSANVKRPLDDVYLLCDRRWLAEAVRHIFEQSAGSKIKINFDLSFARSIDEEAVFSIVASGQGGSAETTFLRAVSASGGRSAGYGSLNLGLPVAERLVQLQGGKLLVSTTVGGNLRIELSFPKSRVVEQNRRFGVA